MLFGSQKCPAIDFPYILEEGKAQGTYLFAKATTAVFVVGG